MEPGDFVAHLNPQRGVEVGKRFIEQQDVRFPRHCSAHGHALTLAAGQFPWLALQQFVQLQDLRGFQHAFAQADFFRFGQLEAETDVVVDAHVRVQGVGLKDHTDTTLARFQVIDPSSVDQQVASTDRIQPGDQAQQCRLSAARRANEHNELTCSDLQADVAQNTRAAQLLVDVG